MLSLIRSLAFDRNSEEFRLELNENDALSLHCCCHRLAITNLSETSFFFLIVYVDDEMPVELLPSALSDVV